MGRADLTEHRRDNHRLPIGGLVLETAGIIQGGTLRLDIWNAEVRGQIMTDKGSISFRTLIHTDLMTMILDLEPTRRRQPVSDGTRDTGRIHETSVPEGLPGLMIP